MKFVDITNFIFGPDCENCKKMTIAAFKGGIVWCPRCKKKVKGNVTLGKFLLGTIKQ